MNLLAPFALAFGLSLPVLLALYLLKVRRTEREVSSVLLWETLRRDLAAHEPWQRLRWSILLVIQLAILAALTLALSRPAIVAPAKASSFVAIVVDTSPSMLATDLAPTRFEQARAAAIRTVEGLPDGTSIAVIEARSSARVVVPETLDRQEANRGLAVLNPAESADNTVANQAGDDALGPIDRALTIAKALARGRSDATIHLFSDGAFAHPTGWDDAGGSSGDLNLRFHPFGTAIGNQAITALAMRATASGPDSSAAGGSGSVLFTRIRNFAAQPARVNATLSADGRTIEQRAVDLPAEGASQLFFSDAPADAHAIQLQITPSGAFELDKLATLVRSDQASVPVLLVSRGNLFLEKALKSVPGIAVFQVTPRAFPTVDTAPYSLIVYDGYTPDRPPAKNSLLINPTDAPWLPFQGTLRDPPITLWRNDDPTLAYVDLRQVRVSRASNIALPDWAHPLIESNGVPLGFVGSTGGQRVVGLDFDIQQSNLPLSAGFPIFVANVVRYLTPPAVGQADFLTPGQAALIRPQPGVNQVVIDDPGAQQTTLPISDPVVRFTRTGRIGLYHVTEVAGSKAVATQQFAVNLFDPVESDLRPRANLADHDSARPVQPVARAPTTNELAPWLLALIVPLMLGEWWWFHRR
jgi:Ca-activated chloride channel homolog